MGLGGNEQKPVDNLVPVTLLCGFLGSGKTTLLKHILETKHGEEDFKCAVIVNDMAEVNIDKSLIDATSLIQSDEDLVPMQNGCICCTLQSDLVTQIIQLTQKQKFNYIIIEASGVSEPHEIAPLFELDDPHDHAPNEEVDHEHPEGPQLGEVARLDTCVTMIDSADFYNNLGSMKTYDQCEMVGTITELMMDQVEFANVIILNKGDLVDEKQQADIYEKVSMLNEKAKIVKTVQSKVNVMEILNTRAYRDKDEFWVSSTHVDANIEARAGKDAPDACTARFDIKSFVYRARKPFHPGRLNELVIGPYFMDPFETAEAADEYEGLTEEEEQKKKEDRKIELERIQKVALKKQEDRTELMGELLRSKGFFWMATSYNVIGFWQQAGNVLRIEPESPWMCLVPEVWEGSSSEELVLKDMKDEAGEFYQHKDRRQEIVFIGHRMKRENIQELFDKCLLTDEEMALGPERWLQEFEETDVIRLHEKEQEQENEEDEECQDEDCEDLACDTKEKLEIADK